MRIHLQNYIRRSNVQMNPPQILGLGFLALIFVGSLLLKLPVSTHEPISWVDAFFTSTSATTVTGLYTIDTNSSFTLFGEIIIMILIQIGGLGFMTIAILIVMMLGKRIGLRERLIVKEALNQTSIGGIISLVKRLLIFTLTIEAIGWVLLSLRWIPQFGFWKGLYYSLFHTVAAFNNAGFSLWEDNLSRFVGDPVVNLVITFLIITGGLGFTVLLDIWYSKTFNKLSLHSKIMLVGTLCLNVIAIAVIFLIEFNNPGTIGGLTSSQQWWASYFQGITTRTAGFNTIPIGEMKDASLLFMILWMFIGAGSVSTGGGIKVTTFVILFMAVIAFMRKKRSTVIYRKTIAPVIIYRALSIVVMGMSAVFIATFTLMVIEDIPFMNLLFEVASAFGTVGLSTGITGSLSLTGKIIIMFMMYLGLVGPLTVVFSLSKPQKEKIRYPSEDVLTG